MKHKHIWLIGLTLTLGWMAPCMASTLSFDSMDQLVSYGMQHNPQIAARRHAWDAALTVPQQLGSLDEPMIGLRFNGFPAQKDGHIADQTRLVFAQKLPFFGILDHKAHTGLTQANIAYWDLALQQSNVTLSLKTLAYQLILTEHLIQIIDKNQANLTQIISITDTKYRAGIGLQAHVLQAQVAKEKLAIERLSLQQQRRALLAEITAALALSAADIPTLTLDYPKLISSQAIPATSNIQNSLTLQKEAAILDHRKALLQVKKDLYLPQFSVQVEYWNNSMMDDQYAGQVMMTLPWLSPKNEAGIQEASRTLSAEEKIYEANLNKQSAIIATLTDEIRTTAQQLQIYESTLLKDATLILQNFQQAFVVNKATFTDYFEAEKTLFQLEKEHALLQNKYHTRLAMLESHFQND